MAALRIDQIWVTPPLTHVEQSAVMFDGRVTPVVSDHYGVAVTIEK